MQEVSGLVTTETITPQRLVNIYAWTTTPEVLSSTGVTGNTMVCTKAVEIDQTDFSGARCASGHTASLSDLGKE